MSNLRLNQIDFIMHNENEGSICLPLLSLSVNYLILKPIKVNSGYIKTNIMLIVKIEVKSGARSLIGKKFRFL